MRSKLFVPCSRPEFFAKALAGDADAISFDLEDSVPEGGKVQARARLIEFLASDHARQSESGKRIIVRVNALASPHFADDIAAIAVAGVDFINLPKAERASDVQAAAAAIDTAGCSSGRTEPTGLLVNIETPRALAHAAEIACAHPIVAGLQAGLNDLFEPLEIDRTDLRHIHPPTLDHPLGERSGQLLRV